MVQMSKKGITGHDEWVVTEALATALVALEQLPRLFSRRSRTRGSQRVGRPENENSSASRVTAKAGSAGGADGPLLEKREKWRTPSFLVSAVKERPAL